MNITPYRKAAEKYGRQNPMTADCPPEWNVDGVWDDARETLTQEIIDKINAPDSSEALEMIYSGVCEDEFLTLVNRLFAIKCDLPGRQLADVSCGIKEALDEYIDAYAESEARDAIESPEHSRWITGE